ncbi:MAG: YgjP-like metallopeptidase domain-containing protein [Pseudomonadota bacterium]
MSSAVEVVRNPRARRARLSVDASTGRVRLTLPKRAALGPALAWAEEKREWIAAQQARLPLARPFVSGAVIPFADGELTIDWSPDRPRTIRREGDRLVCGGPAEGLSRRVTAWLKRAALAVLSEETHECATRAGVGVSAVAVGDPKSRWGSCAVHGAIRYSWRLILAPGFVRRSTVAHEVAHRVHMHHGPAFHALAATLSEADDQAAHAWLRRHGAGLHWFGRDSGSG